MIYANVTRLYEGQPCLYDAAKQHAHLTINRTFSCGGQNGTWSDDPFLEIRSRPANIPQAVRTLTSPTQRDITDPIPLLYSAVRDTIAAAWRPEAFHIIFHSSGYDSRIISAAIRELLTVNTVDDDDWLGSGLLFLSNRWEASRFRAIMDAQHWSPSHYSAFDTGDAGYHFQRGLDDIWCSAPIPIPGNLWQYLPQWAEAEGLLPSGVPVQAFSGLWANEAWNAFLQDSNPWIGYVDTWYGYNCMASLPIRAHYQEFPLVSVPVLELLRRTAGYSNGNILRKAVADYACPEAAHIPNSALDDRLHPIADDLRQELDKRYKATYYGQRMGWIPPTTSEFSTEWGRYSTAMLVEKLREVGVSVQ